MNQAIEAMKTAFTSISIGRAEVPLHSSLHIAPQDAIRLPTPAFMQDDEPSLAGKIASVFTNNVARGLPLIYAPVLVMDPESGRQNQEQITFFKYVGNAEQKGLGQIVGWQRQTQSYWIEKERK